MAERQGSVGTCWAYCQFDIQPMPRRCPQPTGALLQVTKA